MGGPYSPTARLGASPALPDGDAKNVPIERNARDARAYFSDLLLGALDWNGDFGVQPGGAHNAFTLDVGAIAAVAVRDADDVLWPHAYGGGTINQTKIAGGGGTLGAVAQWWRVYAYRTVGGSLDFEIATTAPNATRRFKSTDNKYRYVGCFPTDGSGAPLALRTSNGHTVYEEPQNAASNLIATTPTLVSLAAFVPPHARIAKVNLRTFKPNPGAPARICVVGSTSILSASVLTNEEGYTESYAEVPLTASQEVSYQWVTQDPTPGEESQLAIDVVGWIG